jgi:hypothetical protein
MGHNPPLKKFCDNMRTNKKGQQKFCALNIKRADA